MKFEVKRLLDQPIIHTALHPRLQKEATKTGYPNINGPSLIRVPDWLPNPLGKYYVYFAHHKGPYIRLAYADCLRGPWKLYDGEIMPLEQSGLLSQRAEKASGIQDLLTYCSLSESWALYQIGEAANKDWEKRNKQKIKSSSPTTPHIASPEVIVDHDSKSIRLYYHGVVKGSLQMSKVAESKDGINFEAGKGIISLPYLRIFSFRDQVYGISMPGFLYRSDDGIHDFEVRKRWLFPHQTRHIGLHIVDEILYIFYSVVGDEPEKILYTRMNLQPKDWNEWAVEPPLELLRPELPWEGAELATKASMRGAMGEAVNQLRDPDVFQDEDGKLYLLYTAAGEQAIGIASLTLIKSP
ncbi:MAG: hypothetical protein AAF696_16300 [Bacteroidota bacterium]